MKGDHPMRDRREHATNAGDEHPMGADARAWYSVGEVADMLGVSEMTLYRDIREGRFPAVKIRSRLIVPARALDAMAEAAVTTGGLVDAADWAVAPPSEPAGA
jgi:excisionase family DNA binding protein